MNSQTVQIVNWKVEHSDGKPDVVEVYIKLGGPAFQFPSKWNHNLLFVNKSSLESATAKFQMVDNEWIPLRPLLTFFLVYDQLNDEMRNSNSFFDNNSNLLNFVINYLHVIPQLSTKKIIMW